MNVGFQTREQLRFDKTNQLSVGRVQAFEESPIISDVYATTRTLAQRGGLRFFYLVEVGVAKSSRSRMSSSLIT
jgi:hypothetical protein